MMLMCQELRGRNPPATVTLLVKESGQRGSGDRLSGGTGNDRISASDRAKQVNSPTASNDRTRPAAVARTLAGLPLLRASWSS